MKAIDRGAPLLFAALGIVGILAGLAVTVLAWTA